MIEKPSLSDVVSSFQLSKSVVDVSNINFRDPIEDPITVVADIPNGYIAYTECQSPSGGYPRSIDSYEGYNDNKTIG